MSDGLDDDFCFELDAEGRIAGTCDHLDCETRVVQLSGLDEHLGDLKTDASIANCGLVKDTYWLGRLDTPRCDLEALARAIFDYHTAGTPEAAFGDVSGAEWWVQVKDPSAASEERQEVSFHWDKVAHAPGNLAH
mgnify:CR=1 FL=1